MTVALRRKILPAKRALLHRAWEEGSLTAESAEGTMQMNAKAIGEARTLAWVSEIEFSTFEGELKDANE